MSEEWSLAEGRRRRDRGKGSRLDEEEERVPVAKAATRRGGLGKEVGARVLLLRDPRGPLPEAALTCRRRPHRPGRAPPLPPPRVRRPRAPPRGPRSARRRPPGPRPPRQRLRGATTTWLRRRRCSSGCSCSGRLGGCRASRSRAPAGASRSSSSARTKNAAVSAGRAAAAPGHRGGGSAAAPQADPGGAGREGGAPAAGEGDLRVPAAAPPALRAPGPAGLGGGGGRGSLPPTCCQPFIFPSRTEAGDGVRGSAVAPGFPGGRSQRPLRRLAPAPRGDGVARRAPRAPRAAGERFPAPVAGSSLGAVRGRMRRDSVGGFPAAGC